METHRVIIILLITAFSDLLPQEYDYWKNAPTNGYKIYSIYFENESSGFAVAYNEMVFLSEDGGVSWRCENKNPSELKSKIENFFLSVDIHCSVMQTTNGGVDWKPYSGEREEHFCCVYLKDQNVDYKIASEFLRTVTGKIFSSLRDDELTTLTNHPLQCTEYYSNENVGWALGWYIHDFTINNKN